MAYIGCTYLTCQYNSGGGTCQTDKVPGDKTMMEICIAVQQNEMFRSLGLHDPDIYAGLPKLFPGEVD